MDHKINLKRDHISLPNKWIIKNQSQYETSQYLMEQERLGFNPKYLVTFHYYHPDENRNKVMILKELYGIKRLNQGYKYEFPNTLFFYERGKSHIKFHSHLLLPSKNLKYDDLQSLEFVFDTKIRKSRKCFSKWKKIHIEEVKNVRGCLSYLNKETNSSNYSIDYQNSNPILKQQK